MLSVSRLLNGQVGPQDALRYGRKAGAGPAHLLHYSADKKPVVVWNVTQRCNLHCGHCYADSHDQEYPGELSTEEGLRLIEELADFGVPTVLFSGGEPLTRPDIFELARGRARRRPAHGAVDQRHVDRRREGRSASPRPASPTSASASTASAPLHDKMRGKQGAYDGALRGIRAASAAGLRTGVRFTLHGLNRDQLGTDLRARRDTRAVDRLCVYHLAYAGRGEKASRSFDLEPAETARSRRGDLRPRRRHAGARRRAGGADGRQPGRPRRCCSSACGATQPERADDVETAAALERRQPVGHRGRLRRPDRAWCIPTSSAGTSTVGDVREHAFGEIWTRRRTRRSRPTAQRPRAIDGRCADCRWYDMCNGGLRVRAVSGDRRFRGAGPRLLPDRRRRSLRDEPAAGGGAARSRRRAMRADRDGWLRGSTSTSAPFTIAWEVTRACAYACDHCRADAQPKRDPRRADHRGGQCA